MIVAITGHRPEKLPLFFPLNTVLMEKYDELGVSYVIQGMAAGVDLAAARMAHLMGIPFTCAIPWAGHFPRKEDMSSYENAMNLSAEVVIVNDSQDYPGPWVYQRRNEWMVDHADAVIAVWDGSAGGTANCVKYATKVDKPIFRIDPSA